MFIIALVEVLILDSDIVTFGHRLITHKLDPRCSKLHFWASLSSRGTVFDVKFDVSKCPSILSFHDFLNTPFCNTINF